MNKIQKIWLSVFLGMFLVPEVLWGTVSSLGYLFFKIKMPTILSADSIIGSSFNVLVFVLLFQFIGIAGLVYFTSRFVVKSKIKNLLYLLFGVILISLFVVFYVSYSLSSFKF